MILNGRKSISMSDINREGRNAVFGGAQHTGQKSSISFEVPTEAVPLPSKGIVYEKSSSIYGRETIEIKAMTSKEEDILTSRALIKKGTVISHLIQSCLIDKTINPKNLISGDRNALMISIRITGYGQEYPVEVSCPHCETKSKNEFDLSQLAIRPLDIDPVEEGTNRFSYTLPRTGRVVTFKFLTGADEEDILVAQERKKKSGFESDNLVTTRLQHSIVSVDGVSDRSEISNFIRNLPAGDSRALRKYIDAHEPGIEMKGEMQCPSCGEISEVPLPLGPSFFWPDA